MADLFSQSRDAERHVRAMLKQAQGPAGPPPGGPPPGPEPAPWANPMVPPGLPKIPPASRQLPMEMPFAERATKQRDVFNMDPLAVNQGLDILKAKHGINSTNRLLKGQRLAESPPLADVLKHAGDKRVVNQYMRRYGRRPYNNLSLGRALATKPLDLIDEEDAVARYMAKKKIQASIENKKE